jgi:osmoprotectant transport system ATP-binding protein
VDATADPMIRLDGVSKRYPDGVVAVQELSLDVPRGAVAVLIGPSGCGKTTTMRMINRLVEPTTGRIFVGGEDVTRANAVQLRRQLGYVIQQVGLFPHQNVLGNVETVPKLLGWDDHRAKARAREMLDLVGLPPDRFAKRFPHELSGGQRQRVGVARALAADPPVLLMDEPFGAVDPIARERLQAEFLRLQEQVRKTVVFVTHDMDEAIRLGDRIAVMREGGTLEQYDEPATLLSSPATEFVAEFVGARSTLRRLSVVSIDHGHLVQWPTVDADSPTADCWLAFDHAEADWLVVLDGDRPVGWLERSAASGGLARERMTPVTPLPVQTRLDHAMAALLTVSTPGMPVTADEKYAGVLTAASVVASARGEKDSRQRAAPP